MQGVKQVDAFQYEEQAGEKNHGSCGESPYPGSGQGVKKADQKQRGEAPPEGGIQGDVAVELKRKPTVIPISLMKHTLQGNTGPIFQHGGTGHAGQEEKQRMSGKGGEEGCDQKGTKAVDGKEWAAEETAVGPAACMQGDIAGFPDPAGKGVEEEEE